MRLLLLLAGALIASGCAAEAAPAPEPSFERTVEPAEPAEHAEDICDTTDFPALGAPTMPTCNTVSSDRLASNAPREGIYDLTEVGYRGPADYCATHHAFFRNDKEHRGVLEVARDRATNDLLFKHVFTEEVAGRTKERRGIYRLANGSFERPCIGSALTPYDRYDATDTTLVFERDTASLGTTVRFIYTKR